MYTSIAYKKSKVCDWLKEKEKAHDLKTWFAYFFFGSIKNQNQKHNIH